MDKDKKIEQLGAELDIAAKGLLGWYESYEKCLKEIDAMKFVMDDTTSFMLSWSPKTEEECKFKTKWLKRNREMGLLVEDNEQGF